ncbi:hypothetical protein TrCOL_g1755 [Triparma columacea]|uniref:Aldose 1-epimerase n=1 Tax=Triparma columacea TaxID=722753 RepID=A0A9W7GDD1_9STRA|nr:hypothetical protein TrCOL_g1755 [Triparma columacea]
MLLVRQVSTSCPHTPFLYLCDDGSSVGGSGGFGISIGGSTYLFVEEVIWLAEKGKLAIIDSAAPEAPVAAAEALATEKQSTDQSQPTIQSIGIDHSKKGSKRAKLSNTPVATLPKTSLFSLLNLHSIPLPIYLTYSRLRSETWIASHFYLVWPPSKTFSRSSPGTPAFRVTTTPYDSHFLTPSHTIPGSGVTYDLLLELQALAQCPLKISAVASSGTSNMYSVDPHVTPPVPAPLRTWEVSSGKVTLTVCSVGAAVTALVVNGVDVVLGYGEVKDYLKNDPYFGVVVGRVANRVKGGVIDFGEGGGERTLDCNNGPNHLHGGKAGWSHRVWRVKEESADKLTLWLEDEGSEEGYPGLLRAEVEYSVEDEGVTVKTRVTNLGEVRTPVNTTQHTYFNLGDGERGVLEHELKVEAEGYMEVGEDMIPTGRVLGTGPSACGPYPPGMDFTSLRKVRASLGEMSGVQEIKIRDGSHGRIGVDNNYVLREEEVEGGVGGGGGGGLRLAATLKYGDRSVSVSCTSPGLQVYTGNWIDKEKGKGGRVYEQWEGVAMEPQADPDSVNKKGRRGCKWAGKGETIEEIIKWEFKGF